VIPYSLKHNREYWQWNLKITPKNILFKIILPKGVFFITGTIEKPGTTDTELLATIFTSLTKEEFRTTVKFCKDNLGNHKLEVYQVKKN